jgi:hypothetical protein
MKLVYDVMSLLAQILYLFGKSEYASHMIEHLAQFPTYQTTFNYVIAVSAVLGIYVAFVWELHQDFFGVVLMGKGS